MNIGLRFFGFFMFFITALLLVVLAIQLIRYYFKKTTFPKILTFTTAAGFALLLAIFVYINYFFTFELIDKTAMQPGMGPVLSPNETYEASIYYEPYGGAAGGVNIWVEVTNLKEDTTKVVYYADAKNYVRLSWQEDTSLFVTNGNRSIVLNVETEIYHENGLACQSLLLRNSYETCFQAE